MTQDQATDLIQYLKGLFGGVTAEQLFVLKREFLKYDTSAVERAIDRHVTSNPTINIARLLEQVRDAAPAPGNWRGQFLRDQQQAQDETARIETALSQLRKDKLARIARDVLDELPPATRKLLEKSDPQTSPTLRSMIYQRLLKDGQNAPEPVADKAVAANSVKSSAH